MELEQITELLKDNPDAVTALKGFGEKLAKLPDLETKVASLTTIETDLANIKKVNEDLLKQKDEWKKGKTGTQAELNALLEKIAASDAKMATFEADLKKEREEKASALAASRETDLKAGIVAQGSKMKGLNPEDDFILLKAKGLIGHDADGKPFFNKLNDKGEPVKVANVEELMTWYYEKDKTRVGAMGSSGTGGSHTGGGKTEIGTPTSRAEARAAFRAARGA